jgi:hypothetical protein
MEHRIRGFLGSCAWGSDEKEKKQTQDDSLKRRSHGNLDSQTNQLKSLCPKPGLWPQSDNDKCQNPNAKSNPNDKGPKKNADGLKQYPAKGPIIL